MSHEIETSGGRFWKKLRLTEDCNARKRLHISVNVCARERVDGCTGVGVCLRAFSLKDIWREEK